MTTLTPPLARSMRSQTGVAVDVTLDEGHPRVIKAISMNPAAPLGPPPWCQPNGKLKPEIVEAAREASRGQAAKLPRCSSEARIARNRVPKDRLDHLLRNGAPLSQVSEEAALRVVEKWVRALLEKRTVTESGMPEVIAALVHIENAVPADEPLGAALRRLVPKPGRAAFSGWTFVDDLMEVLELESQFDWRSPMHVLPPPKELRLAIACGREPTIWGPGFHMSTFPAEQYNPLQGIRRTTVDLSRHEQCWIYAKKKPGKGPGPGTHRKAEVYVGVQTPRRGEFSPVGSSRTRCTVLPLFHRDRGG